jgi:hypothetical protein
MVLGLVVLAAGCGSRGLVTGKVNYQGKALPSGTVLFIHERKGSFSSPIKEDGTYQIADVPSGSVKVAVFPATTAAQNKWRGPAISDADVAKIQEGQPKDRPKISDEAMKEKMGIRPTQPKGKVVAIPEKYGNPEQSGLTCTVTGGPQTHNIDLD